MFRRLLIVAGLMMLGATVVVAQSCPDTINTRQGLMKKSGAAGKTAAAIIKGQAPFDLAKAQEILATFAADFPPSEERDVPYPLDVARLRRCLDALPQRERTVVLLSFYDERSAAEVADEIGTTAANVRVIRHRSVERLRGCLDWTDEPAEGLR